MVLSDGVGYRRSPIGAGGSRVILDPLPPDAAGATIGSTYAIHPWELETLVVQLLTTPKLNARDAALNWPTNCMQFGTGATAVNYLRNLENEEAGLYLPSLGIWGEMHRIGQRQFAWQRGYFDAPQLYRYAYIYGQGSCAEYFERTYGLTINDFSLIGVCLVMTSYERPWIAQDFSMEELGVSSAAVTSALRLLSVSIDDARTEAATVIEAASAKQGTRIPTAFQPSLLRRFPVISFGDGDRRLRAPLPDLISLRTTAGLFYDLVGGPAGLRNEASDRFESYGARLIDEMMPRFDVKRSCKYRYRGNEVDTPDILVRDSGSVAIAVECKATRLSYTAQFADNPIAEAKSAYDEMGKGVFQLWRYFSHARRGIIDDAVRPDACGIVLTLDTWLVLSRLHQHVISIASDLAKNDPEINAEDRRNVVFCSIQELEETLSRTSEDSLLATLSAAREPRFVGWQVPAVDREIHRERTEQKGYPFQVGEVLPWWDATEQLRRNAPAQADGDPQGSSSN